MKNIVVAIGLVIFTDIIGLEQNAVLLEFVSIC